MLELNCFENDAGDDAPAAQALAAEVAQALRTRLAQRPRALLLVSGGRSPLPFFAALARQPLPWDRIDLSLVDERCVPHAHADSNTQLVQRHAWTGAARAARWIDLVPTAPDLQDPVALARQSAQAANANPDLGEPAAIVLGIGTDGHTASLFPDAPEFADACTTGARYVATTPGAAPHARVGLSLRALIGQRVCHVWSGGAAKLETIERATRAAERLGGDGPGGDGLSGNAAAQPGITPLAMLIADAGVTLRVFYSGE